MILDKLKSITFEKLRWLYLAGFFLILVLPLFFLPPWFTPLGWGKAITFRIIFSVIIFLFTWQILFRQKTISDIKQKIKSVSLIFKLLLSLFGIYLLATIFSVDPHYSLWGDPNRAGGFMNYSFYIIFALASFLILRGKDWRRLWKFSIFVGIIVALIGIFQRYGVFSDYLVTFDYRPVSTIGNSILFGVYLSLLCFITLVFGIISKDWIAKIYYLASLLFFLFTIVFITQSRAVFVGLIVGFFWFLFFYPRKSGKLKKLKIFVGSIFILLFFGSFYLNANFHLLDNQSQTIRTAVGRILNLTENPLEIVESRISAWKVAWEGIKTKPILGYGPENFVIVFDEHYNPYLSRIGTSLGLDPDSEDIAEWWDRPHSFIFNVATAAGIPALIIYLSLFGTILWQLQKTKKRKSEIALLCHGVQATFITWLVVSLTIFDGVSSYLLSFFLIGLSLHLISEGKIEEEEKPIFVSRLYQYRWVILSLMVILFAYFIIFFNFLPLKANKEMNLVRAHALYQRCDRTLEKIDEIFEEHPNTIIDNYARLEAVFLIKEACLDTKLKSAEEVSEIAIPIIENIIIDHPNRLQNWFVIAQYSNILMEAKIEVTDNIFVPTKEMIELRDKTNYYFERAAALSPRRQKIYEEWLKTDLISGEYIKAEEKANKCLELNPENVACHWLMALAKGYQEEWDEFDSYLAFAEENGYNIESERSLHNLANMYIRIKEFEKLIIIYVDLIDITVDNKEKAQIYASLAFVYKEIGEISKAREVALMAMEILPEAKDIVEQFLKTLE